MKRKQQTLKEEVSFSGIGIHTGRIVSMTICPAPVDTGIVFQRIDLESKVQIPADIENVCDVSRSTTIGLHDAFVHTVEHVLAALKSYQIDNAILKLSSVEPPIGDGSSKIFVDMIEDAGIETQQTEKHLYSLKDAVWHSEGDTHLVALPSREFRISYTLNYPKSDALGSQFYSFLLSPERFKNEIATCRTFACYEEISSLMDQGLIKGGSLDNAIIVKDHASISKDGLHFQDEMVRHKILDLVGDLALIGYDFHAHIIAIRSGHASNCSFAKKLKEIFKRENPS